MKPCPVCGGVLEPVQHASVGVLVLPAVFVRGRTVLVETTEPRRVVACTECEYVEEIGR